MKISETTLKALKDCKDLQGKTIADICREDLFLANLEKFIKAQREEREQARRLIPKGNRLQAHPIDRIIELGLMTDTTRFAKEFILVMNRESSLAHAERLYVQQLGLQAYNKTIVDILAKTNKAAAKELSK